MQSRAQTGILSVDHLERNKEYHAMEMSVPVYRDDLPAINPVPGNQGQAYGSSAPCDSTMIRLVGQIAEFAAEEGLPREIEVSTRATTPYGLVNEIASVNPRLRPILLQEENGRLQASVRIFVAGRFVGLDAPLNLSRAVAEHYNHITVATLAPCDG
jgi:hypothetical protein